MKRRFASLRATSLDPEQHERTCGYWYTVTNGALAHTAFATRTGLHRWLRERNLKLETELPAHRTWGTTAIVGSYDERSYLYDADEFYALRPVLATAVLSNGDYTLGLITEDAKGVRTVHSLNPNVKTRFVFDHRRTREEMS